MISFFYLGYRAFCIAPNVEVSGFSYCIFLIFESSQLSEFLNHLQDSGLQNYFIILGTGLSSHESVHGIVIFQYLIKLRTVFLRHHVVKHILLKSCRLTYCKSHRPKAVALATKMRPCNVLYKATGNP